MSKTVYFKQVEYHQVRLHRSIAIEEDQIIGHGLSVQHFDKLLTYQSSDLTSEPMDDE